MWDLHPYLIVFVLDHKTYEKEKTGQKIRHKPKQYLCHTANIVVHIQTLF